MAEISVFLSHPSCLGTPRWRKEGPRSCHNTTCKGEQALLSGGLVFVKLDFNGTAEGALFIGGVQSFGDIPVT